MLTLRRHGHQPQLEDSTMTTDTEALRAQFEREIGEAAPFPVQRYGDSYAHRICAWAWEGYQAGHAAAKAEAA